LHHAAELLAKPAAKPAAKGEKAGGPKGARSAYMFFCDGARDTIKGEPPVAAGALRLPTAACTTRTGEPPPGDGAPLSAADFPDLTFGESGKKLGEMWKALSAVDKAPYQVPPAVHAACPAWQAAA
jgi:hypothetical protein